MEKQDWQISDFPFEGKLESLKILKSLPAAHAALAELKGLISTIPNELILLHTLGLQEAKDSSAIENIVTTHDDLYRSSLNLKSIHSLEAKEVQNYASALKRGFELFSDHKILSVPLILEVQEILEGNSAGFRKLPGTSLKDASTGKTIYTPPQEYETIMNLMADLATFINDDSISDLDPLVKVALVHHQFESIHPFYDGNGRTGRILNILYLIQQNLLEIPVLYLSYFIVQNKHDYYRLLQEVRREGIWEDWILFIVEGIRVTSLDTIETIRSIKDLMATMKFRLRENYKFYSQDLLNNLFRNPYTKIDLVARDVGVSRLTAAQYLNTLSKDGVLSKRKVGKSNYYINTPLYNLLMTK